MDIDDVGFLRQHKGFGFEPGPFDELDYDLAPYVAEAAEVGITTGETKWDNPIRLDQGAEGACVGFGWTGFLNAAPITHTYEDEYAFDLYHTITETDEYPGDWRTGQSGTSVRSGAKEVQRRGFIRTYAFTYDVEEMALWVLNKGPLVIGVRWLNGMDAPSPQDGYYARVRGPQRGRHCVIVDQVHWGLGDVNWFGFANSWGTRYGDQGRAYFSEKGMRILFNDPNAVACTAVELPQ